MALILGIDTSCDDTGIGLVEEDSGEVRANVVANQVLTHAAFGGVVPERASREHLVQTGPVFDEALRRAGAELDDIACVAATFGPGLVGALLVGLTWGKTLAWARGVPFVPVHHLEGHIASASVNGVEPPYLCLIASGGHTSLFRISGRSDPPVELGRTRDDAAGEAFDKVARLLDLPYPGGPALSALAREGDPTAYPFTRPLRAQTGYDFSFSGLKTAVAVLMEREPDVVRADLAASFEATVVDALVHTLTRAARDEAIRTVVIAGGVAANRRLRRDLADLPLDVHVPPADLATDNGAMVALAARSRLAQGPPRPAWDQDAVPYAPLVPATSSASR